MPPPSTEKRTPLNRQQALQAAVELADNEGIDALSMRNLASRLGVVPMALYRHVTNKEDLLDGMVETVYGEIEVPKGWAGGRRCGTERSRCARRCAAMPGRSD